MVVTALNQTDGAFDYNIVNLRGAVLGVLHVTYFCGAAGPNNAALVIEPVAGAPIFQVATNPDADFQLIAVELNGSLIPLRDHRVPFTNADV